MATGPADDSQTDISAASDDDADAENSDVSDVDSSPSQTLGNGRAIDTDKANARINGTKRRDSEGKAPIDTANRNAPSPPIARSDAVHMAAMRDTEMMMNGLRMTDEAAADGGIDFEQTTGPGLPASMPLAGRGRPETFAERKRREHEEYKKKRDSDPSFVPTRGAFFMHDQRSAPGRGYGGRGRGRGRGAIGGPYAPAKYVM